MSTPVISKVQANDLQIARHIVLTGLKSYRAKIYLFGSQATGKFRLTSDIDVAVLPLETIPRSVFAALREALEESNIVRNVDLINLSETDEYFKARVLQEGILWNE